MAMSYICRVEIVNLSHSNYNDKISIFCEYMEFVTFCITALFKFEPKSFLHICDTYNNLPHNAFRLYLIEFRFF